MGFGFVKRIGLINVCLLMLYFLWKSCSVNNIVSLVIIRVLCINFLIVKNFCFGLYCVGV